MFKFKPDKKEESKEKNKKIIMWLAIIIIMIFIFITWLSFLRKSLVFTKSENNDFQEVKKEIEQNFREFGDLYKKVLEGIKETNINNQFELNSNTNTKTKEMNSQENEIEKEEKNININNLNIQKEVNE